MFGFKAYACVLWLPSSLRLRCRRECEVVAGRFLRGISIHFERYDPVNLESLSRRLRKALRGDAGEESVKQTGGQDFRKVSHAHVVHSRHTLRLASTEIGDVGRSWCSNTELDAERVPDG
jgi:hypothetical protein